MRAVLPCTPPRGGLLGRVIPDLGIEGLGKAKGGAGGGGGGRSRLSSSTHQGRDRKGHSDSMELDAGMKRQKARPEERRGVRLRAENQADHLSLDFGLSSH